MDGYQVMPMGDASKIGDFFCTDTGDLNVIDEDHFKVMKDGAIVANSGHFDVEIDKTGLEELSESKRRIREFVDEYTTADGRKINLLGEGRLVNVAAAEGHPAAVMDMSFANQALSVEWMVKQGNDLSAGVYPVPTDIDQEVARLYVAHAGHLNLIAQKVDEKVTGKDEVVFAPDELARAADD